MLLGVLAGLIAWAVNALYAGLLLSIVDAVYFCYALDRDTQVRFGSSAPPTTARLKTSPAYT